jgi:hypothetical protein
VSTKLAIVYLPEVLAAVSLAPQGRDWLKVSTCCRVVSWSSGPPFWTKLGMANLSLATEMSPARSSSAQPLITSTASGSALPTTLLVSFLSDDPQPVSAAMQTAMAAILLTIVAPLRALAFGQLPLEIGGLGGAAAMLALLLRRKRIGDRLLLLRCALLLGATKLFGCRFALRHRRRLTPPFP